MTPHDVIGEGTRCLTSLSSIRKGLSSGSATTAEGPC